MNSARRKLLVGGAGMAAAVGLSTAALAAETNQRALLRPSGDYKGKQVMNTIITKDGMSFPANFGYFQESLS